VSGVLVERLILFDIDGTLLRVGDLLHQQAVLDAIRDVFEIEASLEGVPLGGMLDSQIVRLTLEKYKVQQDAINSGMPEAMSRIGDHYQRLIGDEDRTSWLLPGIEELIPRLREQYTLSVLTGNARGVARTKLAAAGIDHFFPVGAYGDSARHRHELVPVAVEQVQQHTGTAPQPGAVVLIGDTPRDIEAARSSGSKVVAVATGRYPVDVLADDEPDLLFRDFGDVDHVVRSIEELMD
jgi:phosphoglycolate phosphatase